MLIKNVLSQEHYDMVKETIQTFKKLDNQEIYGRTHSGGYLPEEVRDAIMTIVAPLSDKPLEMKEGAQVVTYSNEYGAPNLPPHFDGDDTEFLFNYQLESNVTWPLGLNKEAIALEDNDVVILRPNQDIHWRPKQEFKDGEYVTMIFVRFYYEGEVDPDKYAHMRKSLNDPIFDDVYAYMKTV